MKYQLIKSNKQYYTNPLKLRVAIKMDNDIQVDDTEMQEMYEDAVTYCENYIHKDIAYTLNNLTFYDFQGDCITIDEGNYNSMSAITCTKDGITATITDYSLTYTRNNFNIEFSEALNGDLQLIFFTGFQNNAMPKQIRRAVYVVFNDFYEWERSSYSVQQAKQGDVVNRLLAGDVKRFFINYSKL